MSLLREKTRAGEIVLDAGFAVLRSGEHKGDDLGVGMGECVRGGVTHGGVIGASYLTLTNIDFLDECECSSALEAALLYGLYRDALLLRSNQRLLAACIEDTSRNTSYHKSPIAAKNR